MIRLAFGAKLGKPGSPPTACWLVAASRLRGSKLLRAMAPRPLAAVEKKWRRVSAKGSSREDRRSSSPTGVTAFGGVIISSTFPNGRIEVHNGLSQNSEGGELERVLVGIALAFPDGEQLIDTGRLFGEDC